MLLPVTPGCPGLNSFRESKLLYKKMNVPSFMCAIGSVTSVQSDAQIAFQIFTRAQRFCPRVTAAMALNVPDDPSLPFLPVTRVFISSIIFISPCIVAGMGRYGFLPPNSCRSFSVSRRVNYNFSARMSAATLPFAVTIYCVSIPSPL